MLSFFRREQTFLDPDVEAWHVDAWIWAIRSFGGWDAFQQTPLVTPTREYFLPGPEAGHAKAQHVFDTVRSLLGMSDWPVRLVARRAGQAQLSAFVHLQTPGAVAGTFGVEGNEAIVTYDPQLLDNPTALVSTLVHEMAHYLAHSTLEPPPGGQELDELATELLVAYAGFGMFGANSAFGFTQHHDAFSQGWSSQRLGYFSEQGWVFALAMFLALRGMPEDAADRWLKPELTGQRRKAAERLRRRPDLAETIQRQATAADAGGEEDAKP